jgi:hypothetical protein
VTPPTAVRAVPTGALTTHKIRGEGHFPVNYDATGVRGVRPFVALSVHGYDMDGEHITSTVVDCLSPDAARALAVILLDAAREAVA